MIIPNADIDAITVDKLKRDFEVALLLNNRAIRLAGTIKPPIPEQNPCI